MRAYLHNKMKLLKFFGNQTRFRRVNKEGVSQITNEKIRFKLQIRFKSKKLCAQTNIPRL